ncbi:uncharacterized protein LOC121000772 isoform X1 [Bufo bufo]|uniref:uncharacterized protein LOC121000772 isoform X1 n=1 Tax=Bufo bufo TaxID=8384 RepID=UPI001ABE83E5|nr:uncharacterized protein LOC121000772 isoform X1 [Bufo bufo]
MMLRFTSRRNNGRTWRSSRRRFTRSLSKKSMKPCWPWDTASRNQKLCPELKGAKNHALMPAKNPNCKNLSQRGLPTTVKVPALCVFSVLLLNYFTNGQGINPKIHDSEPVIKVEQKFPEASTLVAPSEISSSQERSGAQCTRCGTCCNNQCRMGYQWNTQGMFPGSPMDGNQGKPYMTPPPAYFNGSPISPGFASRSEGMSHPTTSVAVYGNAGMVPLSPHYAGPGYRMATDPSSPFQLPERPGNSVFGFEQMPMGPPNSHVDLENRNRNAMFHDRRNPPPPCPNCGGFCNNQCGMNIHWEQRRLHHPITGPVDGAQGHRYPSPPNPYFNAGTNSQPFSNIRPPVRHVTPPVNVQGNSGMIQLSAPYPGYCRPGDAKSPNVFPNKPEHSVGNGIHGGNGAASSPHGHNQGVKYGAVTANSSMNHRRSQSMSPLAAIETMPVFAANNSPGIVGDQRNKPLPQTVTSSDNSKDRNTMPSYGNGRHQLNYSIHGVKMTRVQPATSATGNTGQPNSSPSERGDTASKNTLPSSSTFLGQAVEHIVVTESHAIKRPSSQTTSESGLPAKRSSPPVIIVHCEQEKRVPTPRKAGSASVSITKSGIPLITPLVVGGSQDSKKTPPPEMRDNKRQTPPITISNVRSVATPEMRENTRRTPPITISNVRSAAATPEMRENMRRTPPITISNVRSAAATPEMRENMRRTPPITISNVRSAAGTPEMKENKLQTSPITISDIRSAGIFMTPTSRGPKEMKDSNTIIIIDDKDGEGPPRISPASSSTIEAKTSKPMTPSANNPKSHREPPPTTPPSSTNKGIAPQAGQQGSAVLVNKVQVQQPSPIIVTGGTGLGNQPLSVPVNGNQSFMFTFGSSGLVLATPVNIAENQIPGIKQNTRMPMSKTRLVPTNTVSTPRTVHPKFSSVAMTPVIGQTNTLPVSVPPGHAKPVAINVNQTGNITSTLNINNSNLTSGTLKAVPVSAAGNSQTIPLFVDASSGLILTGSAVSSKDHVGNTTVVTVNRGVVSGNVTPVTLGGKLAFSNLAPVNGRYIINNSPVALTGNTNNFNNKGTLSINNPTILTLNGGFSNSGSVAAPLGNITPVNANRTLQVAPTPASNVVGGGNQKNNVTLVRKVGEQGGAANQPSSEQPPAALVERLFKCSNCDEKFNSLENLTSHQAVHKPVDAPAGGHVGKSTAKDSGKEVLPGTGDDDAPTILYTTQGDDGSTVYVVTV